MSITNASEFVIKKIMSMKRTDYHPNLPEYLVPQSSSEIIIVEHYPSDAYRSSTEETYDIVNFNSHGKSVWTRIQKEDYENLVKDWDLS